MEFSLNQPYKVSQEAIDFYQKTLLVNDWNTWCPGAKVGEVIDTVINPIIFQN